MLICIEQVGALFTEYHRAYVATAVHFSYPLTPWLHPWPAPGVYVHFLLNAGAALAVALGWHYRAAAAALCVGLTALFLMERGVYLNHAYLYCLCAGLLVFIPAHRALSLDVRSGRIEPSSTAPAWTLWLLRFQIAVVYFFAGIAKLEPDWLAGRPVEVWLSDRAWYPVIGGLLQQPLIRYLLAWGGVAFDLLIVPALMWRPTRLLGLIAAVFFHLSNVVVFGVGTFPWFSLMATALFLPAETLARLPMLRRTRTGVAAHRDERGAPTPHALALISVYAAIQLALPLRALLYPGPSVWTEEGATFAWRMMLRDKRGSAYFLVRDRRGGHIRRVNPAPFVSEWQLRTLVASPDLLLQFAHWLANPQPADAPVAEADTIEVRAITSVSLNGRPPQPLVDPRVDLAHERRRLGHYPWIMPLEVPEP